MFVRCLLLAACPVLLAGCMSRSVSFAVPAATKSSTPSVAVGTPLPAVDPEKVEVDVKTRLVKFYTVPGAQWAVLQPGDQRPRRVTGLEYHVSDDVNLDDVQVWYHAEDRTSPPLKLAKAKKK